MYIYAQQEPNSKVCINKYFELNLCIGNSYLTNNLGHFSSEEMAPQKYNWAHSSFFETRGENNKSTYF